MSTSTQQTPKQQQQQQSQSAAEMSTQSATTTTTMATPITATTATTTATTKSASATVATNFPLNKRGHKRSVSLENNAPLFQLRGGGGTTLPNTTVNNNFKQQQQLSLQSYANYAGTLKSRNERRANKYASYHNLEEMPPMAALPAQAQVQQGRSKFQNIRQMFEISRNNGSGAGAGAGGSAGLGSMLDIESKEAQHTMQSLPSIMTASAPSQQFVRKATPTIVNATGSGNGRGSATSVEQRLNEITQQQPQSLQEQREQRSSISSINGIDGNKARGSGSGSGSNNKINNNKNNEQLAANGTNMPTTYLRPIAFKPIPFEPDYRISNLQQQHAHAHAHAHHLYCEMPTAVGVGAAGVGVGVGTTERYGYGSTPSLAPAQASTLKFGSTTDLRHGGGSGIVGGNIGANVGVSHSLCGVGVGSGIQPTSTLLNTNINHNNNNSNNSNNNNNNLSNNNNNNNNNFCNSLATRRRGFRALKNNDSMESIRHTPEHMDAGSDGSSGIINTGGNISSSSNANVKTHSNNSSNPIQPNGKYIISAQCELTPSPSDSGISELEAALKDRDSELSYLRQTMEHNEKDKEAYWEHETKRLKHYYEGQQREYMLKLKKMEQMLALQQFQLKQHKLRHGEQAQKLREHVNELKHELELVRTNNSSLKNSEHNLKDTISFMDKQLGEAHTALATLRAQLEDSEWKVCERNGEIALLKTQLKEANLEITMKDHALVNLKHEHNTAQQQQQQQQQHSSQAELQKYQSQQQTATAASAEQQQQLQQIITLKDQVIVALTNELSKLRKELSDLAIAHEYGEEPCGRYTRLKQQLDNLNEICQKTRKYTASATTATPTTTTTTATTTAANVAKLPPSNKQLDAILQRLKLENSNNADSDAQTTSAVQQLLAQMESNTLDTLIEESTTYAEDIAKLRQKLDDFRINLELEKRQWSAEKDKVLNYQKQLQAHYIHMYQKLRCLDAASTAS